MIDLRPRPQPVLRRARRGRPRRRRPQADPLQPVAGAAVVLLAVPRRARRGAGCRRARRSAPGPGPAALVFLAGTQRAGRRGPVADPGGPAARPRWAASSSRRSTPAPTPSSTASCSACSPGSCWTRPCRAGATTPDAAAAPARGPGRARRRRGARRHRRAARRGRAPRWPIGRPTWPGSDALRERWERRECPAAGDAGRVPTRGRAVAGLLTACDVTRVSRLASGALLLAPAREGRQV